MYWPKVLKSANLDFVFRKKDEIRYLFPGRNYQKENTVMKGNQTRAHPKQKPRMNKIRV